MAQTALAFDQFGGAAVSEFTQEQAEKEVKRRLKAFKSLPGAITSMENKAKRLRKGGLNMYEQQLVLVARSYIKGAVPTMHKEKAERFFIDLFRKAIGRRYFNDAAALAELSGLMIGSQAFGGREAEGEAWNGKVVTMERADELFQAEVQKIVEDHMGVEKALADLEQYDPRGAMILRLQYVEGFKVAKVIGMLEEEARKTIGNEQEREQFRIADSTYHEWRSDAVEKMAVLLGLC